LHAEFDPKAPLGNLVGALFETVAEEHLIQPTFIYDYPLELSRTVEAEGCRQSLVERFELYIGGMEIANGYSELNDPIDQRNRFLSAIAGPRERGDEEAHEMDEDYIRAELRYASDGGEGIGVDRLAMVLTNSVSIRDVILFPHLRPE
jgi:lysyl-tRNA synthetase class 2